MSPQPPSALNPELASFIGGAIPSVWALETLLLLKRSGRPWSAEALVAELRASQPLVVDCLAGLERAGLLVSAEGEVAYAPASPTLAGLCDELEAAYAQRPVAVVNTIAAHRPDPLRGFADSFRLGKWKP